MSRGWKTKDNRSDQHQKAETAIKYARRIPGAGIDIEVLVQTEKLTFDIQKILWYMLTQNFVNPNK